MTSIPGPYDQNLDRRSANFVALSPLSFLDRAAAVYPQQVSVIHGERKFNWGETGRRCRALASALRARGVLPGQTVAAMLPNVPAMVEAHFGVPMCGAVLNALNIRLDPESIAFMLQHGEARVLLTDREFSPVIARALELLGDAAPLVVDVSSTRPPHRPLPRAPHRRRPNQFR